MTIYQLKATAMSLGGSSSQQSISQVQAQMETTFNYLKFLLT